MDVKNLIRNTAQIVNVIELSPGDVIKFFRKKSYGEPELEYAIVTDVMNNGEQGAIEIVTLKHSYNSYEMKFELVTDKSELSVYPAGKTALAGHLAKVKEGAKRALEQKEDEFVKARDAYNRLISLINDAKDQRLTSPKHQKMLGNGEFVMVDRV